MKSDMKRYCNRSVFNYKEMSTTIEKCKKIAKTNTTESTKTSPLRKKDDRGGGSKQQWKRDESERCRMPQDTKSEPEKSCSNRISRRHDRTRSTTLAERNHNYDSNVNGTKSDQTSAKPITHAFLQFPDNDERDKVVMHEKIERHTHAPWKQSQMMTKTFKQVVNEVPCECFEMKLIVARKLRTCEVAGNG